MENVASVTCYIAVIPELDFGPNQKQIEILFVELVKKSFKPNVEVFKGAHHGFAVRGNEKRYIL